MTGAENDYLVAILGAERTSFAVADSVAEMTIFREWLRDGRRDRATSVHNFDAFLPLRYATNEQSAGGYR